MSNRILRTRIDQTIQNNLSHIITTVIVMMIASAVVTAPLGLFLLFAMGDNPVPAEISVGSLAVSLVIGYLSLLVTIVLTYGFSVLLGRFYRNERAVIGHLFWGLRDMKRLALLPFLLYGLILAIAFVCTFILDAVLQTESLIQTVALVLVVVVGLLVLLIFPYLFTFCIMYESPDLPLLKVLQKSRQMLKHKKWSSFCFGLNVMRLPLAVWFICLLLQLTVGFGAVLGRVALYFMLIYQLLAWNALFYDQMDVEPPHPEIPVLEVPPCESATDTPAQN
ncbi:MAG: hypothetical protein MJ178_08645 [Treponemataceae bacterium]|nr:hypothetical protein [Treponemataceae bacterium]